MAWSKSIADKINQLLQPLATEAHNVAVLASPKTVDASTPSWRAARLDIASKASGSWKPRIFRFKADGEMEQELMSAGAEKAIRTLRTFRDSLSIEDTFYGLTLMVMENRSCSVQFDFNDPASPVKLMEKPIVSLFNKNAAMAFDKQIRMDELVKQSGKAGWNWDPSTAELVMGGQTFEAHVLGSFTQPDCTWLWSWNNPTIHETSQQKVRDEQLKERVMALNDQCPVLTGEGRIELLPILGSELCSLAADVLGMTISREMGYDGFYRMPIPFGFTTLLIRDALLKNTEDNPLPVITTRFPQAIAAMPIPDHKAAFISYAESYGLKVAIDGETVRVNKTDDDSESIHAEFDTDNRLIKMNTRVGTSQSK